MAGGADHAKCCLRSKVSLVSEMWAGALGMLSHGQVAVKCVASQLVHCSPIML